MSKIILITGASNGFSRDMAETLFRAGHTVCASMRRGSWYAARLSLLDTATDF